MTEEDEEEREVVYDSIESLTSILSQIANSPVDMEQEEFIWEQGPDSDGYPYWDPHASFEDYLEEMDFFRKELIWMEFNLDNPLRADRLASRIDEWRSFVAQTSAWGHLFGPKEYGRRVAELQNELMIGCEYCLQLYCLMCRLEARDSKRDSDRDSDRRKKTLPRNPAVIRLASAVNKRVDSDETKEQIALEIADGNERQAKSMLRQLRRFPHLLSKKKGPDK